MNATPALRQADVPTLAHWIGGKRTPGASGRFGDVYTPATGALGCRVPFATARRSRPRRRGREGRVSGLGGDHPAVARPRHVPVQGAARAARRRDRRRRLARARQGALRRRGRARARHRDRRVRVRRAAVPEERVQRQRRHRRRRVHAAPAAGRRRRHHAVQLSGDGAAVDVPDGARLRQRVRAEALGARSRRRR